MSPSRGLKHPAIAPGRIQFCRDVSGCHRALVHAVVALGGDITQMPGSLEPAWLGEPEDQLPASLQQAPPGTQAVFRSLQRRLVCCSPA